MIVFLGVLLVQLGESKSFMSGYNWTAIVFGDTWADEID